MRYTRFLSLPQYNYKKPPNLLEAYSKYKNLFKEALDKSALLKHKD